jgi:signal transduction histidine kinase
VQEIYPLAGSGNAEMVRTKSSLLIQTEDFHEHQDRFPMLLSTFQAGFRSIMNVPLFAKGKIIGGLLLRSRKPYAYTDDDVRLAERVGSQIAGAIANAQLYTEHLRSEKERAALEDQLHQAQKMEAVGRLAGGVAHDFNNMLGVIIGHAELALALINPTEPLYIDLQEIRKAAQRSADLTRQLLAFARRQTVSPKVLDLNDTVSGMLKMLGRLIGEDIDLAWRPGRDLRKVRIDPSQIDQILANMAVNARDAIAGVGKITIETGNVVLDDAYCAEHAEFVPGEFVLLAVSDTGAGMSREILAHLFEPFFTTKKMGRGTGLGLATVHGIVKQNGGFINVYSEPGRGTTFKIYLPAFEGETAKASAETAAGKRHRGTETVLIVEDEKAILKLGRKILEQLGYKVLTANTPAQAIHMVRESSGDIHLLITDVVMPEMNGRDLAERLTSIKPGLKCLFMSGYTASVIAHQGVLDKGVCFIQKPFSVKALAGKVREVLEE